MLRENDSLVTRPGDVSATLAELDEKLEALERGMAAAQGGGARGMGPGGTGPGGTGPGGTGPGGTGPGGERQAAAGRARARAEHAAADFQLAARSRTERRLWRQVTGDPAASPTQSPAAIGTATPAELPPAGFPPAGVAPAGVAPAGVAPAGVAPAGVAPAGFPPAEGRSAGVADETTAPGTPVGGLFGAAGAPPGGPPLAESDPPELDANGLYAAQSHSPAAASAGVSDAFVGVIDLAVLDGLRGRLRWVIDELSSIRDEIESAATPPARARTPQPAPRVVAPPTEAYGPRPRDPQPARLPPASPMASTDGSRRLPVPMPHDRIFEGHVLVDAGPFLDIAAVMTFQHALEAVPGTRAVDVTALDLDRAHLELELSDPVALGREIRAVFPFNFAIFEAGHGRLSINVAGATPAAPQRTPAAR
jgi:hypothetical protein